jgi:NAD(P)H-dependent flavin oxidoreductase YrpB (nitropropane dioxygenase family)
MTTSRSFAIRGRPLLPIVQGGMGVGVSAHRLAGAVARAGAMGTIASIDLRHHHADLAEQSKHCRDKDELNRLNFIALDREIKAALDIAAGHGLVAANVMKAVDAHPAYVRQACASGAQAIVMGAGLPLDLAELTEDYPDVADPDPVGCARRCHRAQEMGAPEEIRGRRAAAGRHRDRASTVRRRPPRRTESGRSRQRTLQFRRSAARHLQGV